MSCLWFNFVIDHVNICDNNVTPFESIKLLIVVCDWVAYSRWWHMNSWLSRRCSTLTHSLRVHRLLMLLRLSLCAHRWRHHSFGSLIKLNILFMVVRSSFDMWQVDWFIDVGHVIFTNGRVVFIDLESLAVVCVSTSILLVAFSYLV